MSVLMTESGTSTIPGTKSPCVVVMLALAGPTLSTVSVADRSFAWYESTTFSALHLKPSQELSAPIAASAKEGILEIRKRSGLTWKEIALIFGVSPRAVHLWANGERVSAEHETKLRAVLEKIRRIDQGSAQATASRLRSSQDGAPLFTILGTLPPSALEGVTTAKASRVPVVDQATLMANWRPVAPFRDRWDDEPVGEVVPVGSYPSKRLKVASKRQS